MEKGAPYEGRFAKKQGRSPPHWSFGRTGFVLAVCTPLAIAPVPAAAQMIGFGGFGVGGGLGALGLMHHGIGGGFGSGRGWGRPGFMSHGRPGFTGQGFQGRSSWDPGRSFGHHQPPFGPYGDRHQYSGTGDGQVKHMGRGDGQPSWNKSTQTSRGEYPSNKSTQTSRGEYPSNKSTQTSDGKYTSKKSTQTSDGKYTSNRSNQTSDGQPTSKKTTQRSDGQYTSNKSNQGNNSTSCLGYELSGPCRPTRCSRDKPCPPPPSLSGNDHGGGVTVQLPPVWFPPPPIDRPGAGPVPPRPPHKNEKAPPPPIEPPIAKAALPRPNSGVPAIDERRFVQREVLFELRKDVSPQTADAVADGIARRERLQRLASQSLDMIGTTLYRYEIKDKRSVPAVIASLERYPQVAAVQPNYVYTLQQAGQNGHFVEEQYTVPKMHLAEAHMISNGEKTLVAVIDSGIDWTHPEISGAVTRGFNAIGGDWEKAQHGTEIAGIIASHADLTGVAPQARLLAVRAFKAGGKVAVVGETFDILAGIEWAVKNKAQIVNMSFAGPFDPDLSREVAEGSRRRVIFIAAVGNEGKAAKPSYPAAYENVIPVTATDRADAIFKDASRCATTCIAAPGVDIFAAAPAGAYKHDSGTSMAAAEVSGVVALLLDAKPGLDPKAVRDLLVQTAKHLSLPDPDESSIAGIVDAYAMLEAAAAPPANEGRSVGPAPAPPTPKGVEPPQNAPPVDNSPTGSVKPYEQSDSKSVSTATDAELDRKEDVLWQLKKDGLLSPDQFQRQLQDLETAKHLSINKCPAAPHIPGAVTAEFQESDRDRAVALIHDYGMEAKLNESLDFTKITVPVGQEGFWVDILQASGLFTNVKREDYYCPKSVDTEFGIGHPDIALPAPTANIPRADDLEDVVALLKAKYPKPTVIRVTDRNQRVLKVEVNGLRGSVLIGHNYWERLEIHLVLIKPGEIEAMVEGSYATGVGDSPPATSAYQSMEKDYLSDISRYTKVTFANLQQQ
jgi:subtilisin family serine protease